MRVEVGRSVPSERLESSGRKHSFIIGLLVAAALMVVAGAAAFTAYGADQAASAKHAPVKVGVVLPLSGASASLGLDLLDGLQLGVSEINASGGIKALGGAKIELLAQDEGSTDPSGATLAAQQLVTTDKVSILMPGFTTDFTLPACEVAERAQIPCIAISTGSKSLNEKGLKWFFQPLPDFATSYADGLIQAMKYAAAATGKPLNQMSIAAADVDNSAGIAVSKAIGVEAAKAGIQVKMNVTFPATQTSFTSLASKMLATGADATFVFAFGTSSNLASTAFTQQGAVYGKNPVVAAFPSGGSGPSFPTTPGTSLAFVPSPIAVENNAATHRQEALWAKTYGTSRAYTPFVTEDIPMAYLLKAVLQKARSTKGPALRKALLSVHLKGGIYNLLSYKQIRFNKTGLNTAGTGRFDVGQIQNGHLVVVYPPSSATAKPQFSASK